MALVDDAEELPLIPPGTATIVVLASTDQDGSLADTWLVRLAGARAEELGAELVVAPLGSRAPDRATLLTLVREAYGRPGPVHDFTSASLPATVPTGLVMLFVGRSGPAASAVAVATHRRMVEEGSRATMLLDSASWCRERAPALAELCIDEAELMGRRLVWVATELAREGGVAMVSMSMSMSTSTGPDHGGAGLKQMVLDRGCALLLVRVDLLHEEHAVLQYAGWPGGRDAVANAARSSVRPVTTGEADLVVITTRQEATDRGDAVVELLRSRGVDRR